MKCFIFPLIHSNLFPLTTKPLNIFEPRYIAMIDEALRSQIPVALAYVPENGDTYRKIAGFGQPQLIENRNDQTKLIFLQGLGKVQILNEVKSDQPFIIAECKVIAEELRLDESLKSKYMTLSQVLVHWVKNHISDTHQQEIFIRSLNGPQEIIGAMAAYLIRDYDLQYEMMEIFDINEQIKYIYRLYESGELTL